MHTEREGGERNHPDILHPGESLSAVFRGAAGKPEGEYGFQKALAYHGQVECYVEESVVGVGRSRKKN